LLVDIIFARGYLFRLWTFSLLVDIQFAGGHSVCWWTFSLLVDIQFADGHSVCRWTHHIARSTGKLTFLALGIDRGSCSEESVQFGK
jgi:hypothetical protein